MKEASRSRPTPSSEAIIIGAAVVIALLAAVLLAGQMARQMSRSMRRLRSAAFDVAEQRLPMLVDQLSRTEPGRVDTRVQPIPITTTDEIGEVARAFDQVHREAVRLAAEQALLRGSINAIFTNLSAPQPVADRGPADPHHRPGEQRGRPDQLENLFTPGPPRDPYAPQRREPPGPRGEEPGRRWDQPVPLVDVLRAAASEVEQYERVELSGVGGRHPRPRGHRPRAPARRAAGERDHVLVAADQGPRHRDPSPRRPHH
ncbi:HAMP domain-containing protein [Streptomyces sp. KL116D]|uniref:HAMP domain-containing protein n=1 Tax=Streptomyces sp. KL116D TaxID=3045152 RepID=UPI003557742D